ncbi:SCO1860 family LAETG-anchored protein [Streptomyces sp. DSM 44915]|uniref:SCO1860 family LAETG-anchored protein n=1 Tax=Streptomyces chisholmiae TaxID=3075540 RepID=A0ABU2JJL3_9ACTN|nr:SCO1860 family LAETG-anchored protein [Streptomyces sp. DSM 44915]MDT0265180.1 SCO1860 family LAETG-anchored protein [Streptomyces sp. DSM 44915]
MYNSALRLPVSLALGAACGVLLTAPPAVADDGPGQETEGSASAAVLRTALDVSLLDGTARLPLTLALNEVHAPADAASADETLLTATLDGVADGRPFEVLAAEVASAEATVDQDAASAETALVDASVHLPGLAALPLLELTAVSARAHCPAGAAPTAETEMPATATVLGRDVTLDSSGSTEVAVPGVGQVTLTLGHREANEADAAATALDLAVEIDPLELNVATVSGRITLAEARCQAPAATEDEERPATEPAAEEQPAAEEPEGPRPDSWRESEPAADLAETGGSSNTPYLVGGALALLGVGLGTVFFARRRALGARDSRG